MSILLEFTQDSVLEFDLSLVKDYKVIKSLLTRLRMLCSHVGIGSHLARVEKELLLRV